MARGLLGTIEFMVAVVLAARVTLLGVDNFARGQTGIGVVFVGLAAALLVIEWYAPSPTDIPGAVLNRTRNALPGRGGPPESEDDV
ncbi:hypothetical protein [Haloarcula sp. JP-L23]|uniref:DUF7533 family protein n=1 Tax=Haloarcula sp. JP-L23 TaxID=2716717 RepID=UPI00140F3525|nr:hypothetical protein G9465_04755 [Haloarcula sp. JP-L23]